MQSDVMQRGVQAARQIVKRERGIHEIFTEDPARAHRELWGRGSERYTRRAFLADLGVMSTVLGARVVYAQHTPVGLIPATLANSPDPFHIDGKDGLVVLNDRPLNPEWNGVLLRDVLADCGIARDAVYVAYWGADTDLSGTGVPISRGVPISKAMQRDAMIAWGINGRPLHTMNGYPLRLVFGGWPGSTSGKWLRRISVRNVVHDGPKMGGHSYRIPCEPVMPGTTVAAEDMCIIEAMPIKSLITAPASGSRHPIGWPLHVHGHAWVGDGRVRRLRVSIDFGRTWRRAELWPPANQGAWANWDFMTRFPTRGYYEIWARAVDDKGHSQPMVVPGWNPKGYLNNACHRIAVNVV